MVQYHGINMVIPKPVTRRHLNKCPYMTGVPSSHVHFNVKVHFGSQKMQFRHHDSCPLVADVTVVNLFPFVLSVQCMKCPLFRTARVYLNQTINNIYRVSYNNSVLSLRLLNLPSWNNASEMFCKFKHCIFW